jgi:hypothetical protein
MGLLFHLLTGGEDRQPGFQGHVMGGMGAITEAMRRACVDLGVTIRTAAPVARIEQQRGVVRGVTLESGETIDARVVVSNADPRRTFLGLLERGALDAEFVRDVEAIDARLQDEEAKSPVLARFDIARLPSQRVAEAQFHTGYGGSGSVGYGASDGAGNLLCKCGCREHHRGHECGDSHKRWTSQVRFTDHTKRLRRAQC